MMHQRWVFDVYVSFLSDLGLIKAFGHNHVASIYSCAYALNFRMQAWLYAFLARPCILSLKILDSSTAMCPFSMAMHIQRENFKFRHDCVWSRKNLKLRHGYAHFSHDRVRSVCLVYNSGTAVCSLLRKFLID